MEFVHFLSLFFKLLHFGKFSSLKGASQSNSLSSIFFLWFDMLYLILIYLEERERRYSLYLNNFPQNCFLPYPKPLYLSLVFIKRNFQFFVYWRDHSFHGITKLEHMDNNQSFLSILQMRRKTRLGGEIYSRSQGRLAAHQGLVSQEEWAEALVLCNSRAPFLWYSRKLASPGGCPNNQVSTAPTELHSPFYEFNQG